MAFSICEQLLEFLNVANTVSCNEYPTPMENYFYLIAFPTIVIIIFIYIVSSALTTRFTKENTAGMKGIRLLIAGSAFMFIVLQGLYSLFIPLAKFWFWVVIVIGGLWFFFWHHFKGESSSGGYSFGKGKSHGKRLLDTMTGGLELNPFEHAHNKRMLGEDIKRLKLTIKELEEARKNASTEDEKGRFVEKIAQLRIQLKTAEALHRKGKEAA
ncbi:MAG: hypothetical protein KKA90_00550 [Nanoarchaeota archaeon]|nr:hypothetical protein [Nanoarchaeota archaeon]